MCKRQIGRSLHLLLYIVRFRGYAIRKQPRRAGEKPFWASDPLLKTFLLILYIFSLDSGCNLLSIGAKTIFSPHAKLRES